MVTLEKLTGVPSWALPHATAKGRIIASARTRAQILLILISRYLSDSYIIKALNSGKPLDSIIE